MEAGEVDLGAMDLDQLVGHAMSPAPMTTAEILNAQTRVMEAQRGLIDELQETNVAVFEILLDMEDWLWGEKGEDWAQRGMDLSLKLRVVLTDVGELT